MEDLFKWLALLVFAINVGACNPSNSFSVDTFNGSPVDSEGVGCFFSEEVEPEKQIFASGLDNCAYVAINNKLCKFEQDTVTQTEASNNAANMSDIFRNENYTIILEVRETGLTDGGASYKGTMTVKNNKTGKKVVKKVSGGCGC